MNSDTRPILPKAILFDMDGTLTEPLLDFPAIKAEMGIGSRPILEALAEMNEEARRRAQIVLHRHEQEAAARSTLNPGCRELLDALTARGVLTALITRNSYISVRTVLLRHALTFEVLVTRDDAPPKPDPQPLLLACRRLGVGCDEVWMVGDGQYDIEAGLAAGIRTVWLSHHRQKPFDAAPWREVCDLPELAKFLLFDQSADRRHVI
ncbi:MAG TPA: HAD family hydrolase [Tepidisphaeraceae bacterium]|jgi:HAD superfamily hydrolase (TIGR01509 family)|nr:HAD family hydrolase [Tepidisphaeraceae bacterium]